MQSACTISATYRNARFLGDLRHAGCVKTVRNEQPACRRHDFLAAHQSLLAVRNRAIFRGFCHPSHL